MVMHIVTSRCFLACEKVTSVCITEIKPDILPVKSRSKKRKPVKGSPKKAARSNQENEYRIVLCYYPLTSSMSASYNNAREPTEFSLEVIVPNKKQAFLLYSEIIKEIQEQHPTEGYLDQLVSKLLSTDEFQINSNNLQLDSNF